MKTFRTLARITAAVTLLILFVGCASTHHATTDNAKYGLLSSMSQHYPTNLPK